jgi:anti-sigma-K factor RskA
MSICLSPPQRQSQLQQQLAGVEEELAQASSVIADKQGAREPLVAAVAANDAAVKQLRQEMAAAHHQ